MRIIGRNAEKEMLNLCLSSKRPEFLAVYGRRRVGKTFLIREYCSKHIVFSISGAVNTPMKRQLSNFREALEDYSGKHNRVKKQMWLEPFSLGECEAF